MDSNFRSPRRRPGSRSRGDRSGMDLGPGLRRDERIVATLGAALTAALLSQPALAQAPAQPYRQPPAVAAKFADVPIPMQAPALAPGRTDFTNQAEMEAFLLALKERAPSVHLGSLGRTPEGRDLPYLVFTREGYSDPARVRRLKRPIVWLVGQQHGDEVAGGEAMLALASALADGELQPLLNRITVVIVPRANADGAAAGTRRTSADFDLNRDHLVAALPETRAIQAKMAELPPDVVVDAHEYGGVLPWLPTFGALAPWDGTFLESTNLAVPPALKAVTRDLFRPAIEAKLARFGLSNHDYLTVGANREVSTGGSAAGIGRNYYGLTGAVAFLLETRTTVAARTEGANRESFQRRVATHYVFASAALETAAREPRRVRAAAARARRELARAKGDLILEAEMPRESRTLVLMDPVTGEPKPVEVVYRDGRALAPVRTRPRPRGYVVDGSATAALEAFRAKGLVACPLAPASFEAEAFRVTLKAPITRASREAINPEETAEVALERRTVTAGSGAVWFPMRQTGAAVLAAALEPDVPGSFVSTGLVRLPETGDAPIWRVPQNAPRPKLTKRAPAACRR